MADKIACLIPWQLHAGDHKIQVLMTVPRTVSAAFERPILQRGDHKVLHEPWSSAHIYHFGHRDVAEIIEAHPYEGIIALCCAKTGIKIRYGPSASKLYKMTIPMSS